MRLSQYSRSSPSYAKRYWGRRFWARGYFCTTCGNVTNETILNYIANHTEDVPTDNRR
ncbi:MAG: transposase [Rickettsiales bacterium]